MKYEGGVWSVILWALTHIYNGDVRVAGLTNSAVHPSIIHDRNGHKWHDTNANQEVTDCQINNEHWRHRVECLCCHHNHDDQDISYQTEILMTLHLNGVWT